MRYEAGFTAIPINAAPYISWPNGTLAESYCFQLAKLSLVWTQLLRHKKVNVREFEPIVLRKEILQPLDWIANYPPLRRRRLNFLEREVFVYEGPISMTSRFVAQTCDLLPELYFEMILLARLPLPFTENSCVKTFYPS